MRIFDFITEEVVDEAISLTKHEEELINAVKKGIVTGLASLEKPFMSNENLQEILNDDNLSDRYARQYMQREAESKIEKAISKQMKMVLDQILGKDAITKYRFGTMKGMGGYVQDTTMVINRAYVTQLIIAVMNRFNNYLYDNYNAGERTKGMSFIFRMLKGNDSSTVDDLTRDFERFINPIVSIITHEAVHIVQHKQQAHRPNKKTEYRSYLDKTKGEFYAQAMKAKQSKNKDRYYDLYYSSPQEIAAFAHQMAMDVIKSYDLNNISNLKDIPKIEGEDIVINVNQRLNNRFAKPRNPQEMQVRRRYLKLVYQEVQRYIDHVKQLLDPQRGVPKN